VITYQTFYGEMLTVLPEFASIYAANMAANDGDVQPHPLMKDFEKFFVKAFHGGQKGLVNRSVKFLEQAMVADDSRVPELIRVSFLENLLLEDDLGSLRAILGSRLQDQLAIIEKKNR
jgi:hypothetical protein